MKRASLNHVYRLVWNSLTHAWVAVAETTKARGKRSSGATAALTIAMLAATPAHAVDANALPTGGSITAGQGSITTTGNTLNVTQGSQRLIADWTSYNIGSNAVVNYLQPSSSSIALNRIAGTSPSQILGHLNANGQVWLLNPAGIVFGQGAQVDVGGLVASSLNISNDDFLNGKNTFTSTGNAGSVINAGNLTGKVIALVAPVVKNSGSISATGGSAVLAAGNQVSLDFTGDGLINVTVDKGALNALAENSGSIEADGGLVVLTAQSADALTQSAVNNTGVVRARTLANKDGKILLLGDMENGTVNVGGTLDASAPDGGNGGFVETSAAHVKVANSARVTTKAVNGQTGTWLIDPVDFTVAASGGDITGAAVSSALASNNFTILSSTGSSGTNGNINVNDSITWNANRLTLTAQNNININAALNGSGTAGLALEYGQGAVAAGNISTYNVRAPVNLASTGSFSTKLGSDGVTNHYTIITSLGAEGSTTSADLQGINGNLAGKYVLGADIAASGTAHWDSGAGFTALGNTLTNFTGVFDGLGHTIDGLTINRAGSTFQGLFGYTDGATLRNVGLTNANVVGYNYTGALVGANLGTVSNSYATGIVAGYSVYIGGLVGVNYGTVSNSYATGTVTGSGNVGGLVGANNGTVSNSYATGGVTGSSVVGGLVGANDSMVSNSYATGAVTGSSNTGGLVGANYATVISSYATGAVTGSSNTGGLVGANYATVSSSFWNTETSGKSTSAGGTGKTSAQMKQLATFTGWDIDDAGGTGKVWRIYEGSTAPLLRSFLTPLTLTPAYDGSGASLSNIGAYTASGTYDTAKVLGSLAGGLTLSSTAANSYTASLGNGLYSTQQGYDITASSRTISTPGSAAGDIVLSNPISWSSGTLNFDTSGTIHANAAISGTGSAVFNLKNGTWSQVGSSLPGFDVYDFRLSGGTFIRALSGDGSTGTPYQLADIYGVQGIGSSGMLSNSYALANDVDASGTAHWDSGAGFTALGNTLTNFTGVFDGLGHTIDGLTINRAGSSFQGLFGYTNGATLRNVGLTNINITGGSFTGGLVGDISNSTVSNSHTTGAVSGSNNVGGLVGFSDNSTVGNSYATSLVTGSSSIGGLIGDNDLGSTVSNSYATGAVSGSSSSVGGLVGHSASTVSNSYATGAVSGSNDVGGLVGYNDGGTVSNSYATGAVSGNGSIGGLVGVTDGGTLSNSYATGVVSGSFLVGGLVGSSNSTVSNSFWNTETSGQSTSAGGTGKTSAQMKQLATFAAWDIDNAGGTGKVWRIYEGSTAPLLRSFLTPLTLTPAYDGSSASLSNIGAYTASGTYDTAKVLGSLAGGLTLSSTAANSYTASLGNGLLYSTQQGYDITASSRTISTPGSAAGDIVLSNPISWSSGTLNFDTSGTIHANAAISGTGSAVFNLKNGTWSQVGSSLPGFDVYDFRLSGGTFIRALSGDGSTGTPYQLADIYGVQGIGSSGMLSNSYVLANDVDASGTAHWNSGKGFASIGNNFSGIVDGQQHAIDGLTINLSDDIGVGLFRSLFNGEVRNLALTDVDINGYSSVGGLVGSNYYGTVSNVSVQGRVVGSNSVGGLVG